MSGNPWAARWRDIHSKDGREERKLANLEAQWAEEDPVETCGKCSGQAYYRPGVGAYQCVDCRAIRNYQGSWV